MKLIINGEPREINDGVTIGGLLQEYGLQADRVVLELNREILRPNDNAGRELQHGDRLEIIQFVGGG